MQVRVWSDEDLIDFIDNTVKAENVILIPDADSVKLLQDDDAPSFSRGNITTGLTAPQVNSIVSAITERWGNAPDVVVASSMDDPAIPKGVRDYDQKQKSLGAKGNPEGFVHGGKVYLLADQLANPTEVMRVLFHESLGHMGLRGVFGDKLDGILKQLAGLRRSDVAAKAEQYGLDMNVEADRMQAAEEVLAELAQTKPEMGYVKRAIGLIRGWLRANVPGFGGMKLSDSDIIAQFILPARRFIEGGSGPKGGPSELAMSRSAMKSIDANVRRGLKSLAKALDEKTTVHRAMFRNGLGWVDFVWGDTGTMLTSGKTKGAMGLSHIIEARQRKDGMSEAEAMHLLDGIVGAIADGTEIKRNEVNGNIRVGVESANIIVWLAKTKGNNAWVVTGYEKNPDGTNAGRAAFAPTSTAASLTRDGRVAGFEQIVGQSEESYNPDIRYSRSLGATLTAGMNNVRDGLTKATVTDLKHKFGNRLSDFRGLALQTLGRRQLVDIYAKDVPELNQYNGMVAQMQDSISQLYLASLPDLSWAKHGINRKGTPGFSQDARRAFAQNMFHGGNYLAKLRYADKLQASMDSMQEHVDAQKENEDYDSVKGQQVIDEMVKRHELMMNPNSNPISTALTSFGFVFHLGLSPASALVNLSQTALVAYPIMGAKWGYGKASAALLAASKQAAGNKNDISKVLTGDELTAYNEAVRSGVIDVTQAHDLAGIAQGEDSKISAKIRPVMKWASFMFHHAEKFNRQVTFVAAYRLAKEAGVTHDNAYADAVKATYDGHFDYAASNRPRVMQGNWQKVILLFKQYAQNMIYTLSRNLQQAIQAETPEGRAEARKTITGLLVSHAMAAGVFGLPMVGMLLSLASSIGGDDDEPWDAQAALQNMLADTFGQKPAEVFAHGLSRLTPWDISGRVGLNKLLLPDIQEGLEGTSAANAWLTSAAGPVAGIMVNAVKGLSEMGKGDYQRGLESMMPTALRGPLKAYRFETEGNIDKTGVALNDEVGLAGVVGQALGLAPSETRLAQEGIGALVATLASTLNDSMALALAALWIGFCAGLGLGLSHERLDKWLNRVVG